jgi:hypothetical protein
MQCRIFRVEAVDVITAYIEKGKRDRFRMSPIRPKPVAQAFDIFL